VRSRSSFKSLIGLFSHLRVIIALVVIGALGITAAAFMIFTQREVTRSMLAQGDAEARNIMRVIMLNLADNAAGLEFFRKYARGRYEQQLRDLVSVIVSEVDFFHDLYQKGVLTEEQARRAALDAVQNARYGNNDYFFIYDRNNVAISHADPRIRGRDMSHSSDVNGRPVAQTMWNMTREHRDGFLPLWWTRLEGKKPVPKLLYFYHYPKWDWLIGTGLYIDDIDRDVAQKMDEIMGVLKRTFNQVHVSETGYFSLFDGSGKILIHPGLENADGSVLKNPVTGGNHLQDLIAASGNPAVPHKYFWDKPDDPGNYRYLKFSHVERFTPFNWYVSSSVYQDEMEKPAGKIVKRQAIFVGIVVLFSMIAVYLLLSRVTAPLAKLTWHAAALQKSDFALSKDGERELLQISFPKEIGRLARTFWNMEQRLDEYLKNLQETTAAREKIESELRIARDIQMSMLPNRKTVLAGRTEIDIYAVLEPAREVGGDLYDFFFIDEDHFCFIVGDVSDKGVPAALFMARSKALLRSAAQDRNAAPGRILQTANMELADGNEMLMFITVFLGILNIRTGEVVFSNAAHVPPVLFTEAGQCRTVELPVGKPLGITKRAGFKTERLHLQPRESLLVFTDGVTEAENREKAFFGDERLLTLLGNLDHPAGANRCVDAVLHDVKSFSEGAPQSDDITVLCVRYAGVTKTSREFRTSLANDLAGIERVLDEADGFMQQQGCPLEAGFDLRVALEEILVNIVNYGMEEGTRTPIILEMKFGEGAVYATVSDPGRPFNPLSVAEIDTQRRRSERKIGGLGLHLVRSLVDELSYQRQDGRNILQITKNI